MAFRTDLRAGCKTVLDAYKTANPNLLAHVYDHRPPKFLTPCAFVDNVIPETMTHDSGTRQRVLIARVYVVNKYISNDQTADEQDALVDGVVDAFTANHSVVAQALIEPVSVDPEEVGDDGGTYSASVINVQARIRQGRI